MRRLLVLNTIIAFKPGALSMWPWEPTVQDVLCMQTKGRRSRHRVSNSRATTTGRLTGGFMGSNLRISNLGISNLRITHLNLSNISISNLGMRQIGISRLGSVDSISNQHLSKANASQLLMRASKGLHCTERQLVLKHMTVATSCAEHQQLWHWGQIIDNLRPLIMRQHTSATW